MKLPSIFKNRHNQAIISLIAANIIWGAASPIFKLSLQNIPPFTLAFCRFFLASLILLPVSINKPAIKHNDRFKVFLIAFLGVSINISFFFLGLTYAPSINAPMIASSGPIFLYIASITLLHEKPHFKIFTGTIVSLLGVLFIIGQPVLTSNKSELIGNLFFLIATLGAVGHAIISKEVINHHNSPVKITFWSFLIGSLTFFPFFIQEIKTTNIISTLDWRGVVGIIYGTFFSSALAYTLYEKAIVDIDSQDIGIFTYIDPLIAVVIALPLLGESITPLFILGSIFIFTGIFIAEGRFHYHPIHRIRR